MTKSFHSCSKCRPQDGKGEPLDRASAEQVQYEIEAGSCGAIKED